MRLRGRRWQADVSETIEDSLYWVGVLGFMEFALQMKERH
jgi:hypothetical protein